jgi:hypothetical protein
LVSMNIEARVRNAIKVPNIRCLSISFFLLKNGHFFFFH